MNATDTGKTIQGIHDQNHFPSSSINRPTVNIAERRADAMMSFAGNYYNIAFPFSSRRLPGSTVALEKSLVYFSMILLLAAVAVLTPVIVLGQYVDRKASGDHTSWLSLASSFIPEVIMKELGVCLGFITIPILFAGNALKCIALSVKALF